MKKSTPLLLGAVVATVLIALNLKTTAADGGATHLHEYATIRFDGLSTHVVRPNGEAEKLTALLKEAKRPGGIDEHTFFMNVAMNALAREGYELAGMSGGEVVMKRAVRR